MAKRRESIRDLPKRARVDLLSIPAIDLHRLQNNNYAFSYRTSRIMAQQDKYQIAIKFSAEKHGTQKVPGTSLSYVVHLSNVAMEIIVASNHTPGFDLELAVQVALLHDTIEDTATTYDEVKDKFGAPVADGVSALTKRS